MRERPSFYVGVTGFTSWHQTQEVLTPAVRLRLQATGRKLMVGVLASDKTLREETPDGKWRWRYPNVWDIVSIFPNDRDTLNLVHFNTKQPDLANQLIRVHDLSGPYFDGFQLNMIWPDSLEIAAFTAKCGRKRIVFQLNAKAIAACGGDARKIIDRLYPYHVAGVTDILFDLSAGEGFAVDFLASSKLLCDLHYTCPHVGIGVAGGLGPESMEPLKALFDELGPIFSCDAEGRLRTIPLPENAESGDDLDTLKARAYVTETLNLIQK